MPFPDLPSQTRADAGEMAVRYSQLEEWRVALLDRPEITTHLLPTGFLAGGICYRAQ